MEIFLAAVLLAAPDAPPPGEVIVEPAPPVARSCRSGVCGATSIRIRRPGVSIDATIERLRPRKARRCGCPRCCFRRGSSKVRIRTPRFRFMYRVEHGK
jgi:hypothetical protein